MNRIIVLIACVTFGLTSCLETSTTTTINGDGSGTMVATMDVSQMMKMMAGKKEAEDFMLDTTIKMGNHSDTASTLNIRQKELLSKMSIRLKMDTRNIDSLLFIVQIHSPFKDFKSLEELQELMKKKEYDEIFDKAFNMDMLKDAGKGKDADETEEEEVEERKSENDNLFGSVFPAFYICNYKKGFISCQVDTALYNIAKINLKAMDIQLDGEVETNMLSGASFTNRIVLPAGAKKIQGGSWVPGEKENVLIQKGNLLDLYKHPEKYAYTIQY